VKRLILIRHGVTDWNQQGKAQGQTDIPLNETGRSQARALAKRMAGWPVDALYTSDLSRARETAEIVGEGLGLEPIERPAWRELNLGELEGATRLNMPAGHSFVAWVASGVTPGGCEAFEAFRTRLVAGLEELRRDHPEKIVAVVSHGGALKTLIADLIGLGKGDLDRISLRGNASLSILEFPEGRARLTLLNDTAHYG